MSTFIDLDPDEPGADTSLGEAAAPGASPGPTPGPSGAFPMTAAEAVFHPLIASIPVHQTPGSFLRGAVATGASALAGTLAGTSRTAGLASRLPDPGPFPLRAILLVGATGAAAAYVGAGIAGLVQAGVGLPLVAVVLAWSGASTLVVTSLLWQPRIWALGIGVGATAVAWSVAGQMAAGALAAAAVIVAVNGLLLIVGSILAWNAARGFDGNLSRWRRDRAAFDAALTADAARAGRPAGRP